MIINRILKHQLHLFFICFFGIIAHAQYLNLSSDYTDEQLINDIFIGQINSSCITVDNISIKGWNFDDGDKSYGYFEKGSLAFPIDKGIVLTTGKLQSVKGPNLGILSDSDSNWRGDMDLENALRESNSTDATILEFDFVSTQSTRISFDYMFASEQYLQLNDRGNCGYTDGFVFLIKKANTDEPYRNLAVLPNTSTPVSVNTVYGNGGKCTAANPQYFDQFNPQNSATDFNGQTKMLTATSEITPGEKYHLKIVIADQGNGLYDSGVFLRAGSFVGNKELGDDLLFEEGKGLCDGETHLIDATTAGATAYTWYKDGEEISGENNPTLTVDSAGDYEVEIVANGCKLKGFLRVEIQPEPFIGQTIFEVCDDNFDGQFTISFRDFLRDIVSNYTYGMSIKFYENEADARANTSNDLDTNSYSFPTSSKTVFARIQSGECEEIIRPITFQTPGLSIANPTPDFEICDEDLSGNEEINLMDYVDLINSNLDGNLYFFFTQSDAENEINSVSATQLIDSDRTFYVRFKAVGFCPNITILEFKFKQPKKSEVLIDQTICKNATTTLDAGTGFDSYLWLHSRETTQSISNVEVGIYQVRLEFNGCFYTQTVEVKAAEDISIDRIDIQGSTVTVFASGGNHPYLYALDNGPYQNSNVFFEVNLGFHTVHVISKIDQCTPISKDFSVIELSNFISPNGDGYNDVLDFSQLLNKLNPSFIIFDRYGRLLFEGNEKNQFIWDGKLNGIPLETGNYWYQVEWTEPTSHQIQKINHYILLKNK